MENLLNNEVLKKSVHENGYDSFVAAVKTKNRGIIDTAMDILIAANGDNYFKKFGLTPLHTACLRNDALKVLHLLNSGSDVNTRVLSPETNSAEELTEKWEGSTPLHFAVEQGHTDIVLILLLHQAKVNAVNFAGMSPKTLAFKESERIVLNLISLAEKNFYKYLPHINYEEFTLKKQGKVSDTDEVRVPKFNLLQFSVDNMLNKVTKILVQGGTDLNLRSTKGSTALHTAVLNRDTDLMELLLSFGADFNVKSSEGKTALEIAVEREFLEEIEVFAKYYSEEQSKEPKFRRFYSKYVKNVDMKFKNRSTMLQNAIETGNYKRAESLIQVGANVNLASRCKLTPLHVATEQVRLDIMELLLKNGALVCARNYTGATALHFISRSLICSQNDENWDTSTHYVNASRGQFDGTVRVPRRDFTDNTNVDMYQSAINLLLRYSYNADININAKDSYGRTPLSNACCIGNLNAIRALVELGADVDTEDNEGKHLASCIKRGSKSSLLIIRHLKKLDAIGVEVKNREKFRELENCYNFDRFEAQCREELDRMKCHGLDDETTLYDILIKCPDEVLPLIENGSFGRFEQQYSDDEYPLYSHMIRLQFLKARALEREYLIEGIFTRYGLPELCTDVIRNYLKNKHVKLI